MYDARCACERVLRQCVLMSPTLHTHGANVCKRPTFVGVNIFLEAICRLRSNCSGARALSRDGTRRDAQPSEQAHFGVRAPHILYDIWLYSGVELEFTNMNLENQEFPILHGTSGLLNLI